MANNEVSHAATTPGPRSVDDPSRRGRILTAAIDQLSLKGFAAMRVDEVASAAGVNKQLIYYYFGDKSGLYDAALQRMVDVTAGLWARIDAATSILEIVQILFEQRDGLEWRRLLVWEGIEHGADDAIRFDERRREQLGRLSAAVRRIQQSGGLSTELDTEFTALMLLSASLTPSIIPQVAELITGLNASTDEFARRQRAAVTDLVAALSRRD